MTQISVRAIHIRNELYVNLLEENQYQSRLLAGTLVGRSLLILGEPRSTNKDGRCLTFPWSYAYLFIVCVKYMNFVSNFTYQLLFSPQNACTCLAVPPCRGFQTIQPLEVCITYLKNHTQLAEQFSSQFQYMFLFFKL